MATQVRKYLTKQEVSALMGAAKRRARKVKNGHRDATMIRAAYVHGLRVSELVNSGGPKWT